MAYLWIKALHIALMVTWFAGIFYLPRLFIYHVDATDEVSRQRFGIMEKRLFALMSVGAILTVVLGLALIYLNPALLRAGWFQLKLVLVALMIVYHLYCRRWIFYLERDLAPRDSRWLRWFNEIPVVFLLGIVILAIVKPF